MDGITGGLRLGLRAAWMAGVNARRGGRSIGGLCLESKLLKQVEVMLHGRVRGGEEFISIEN